MNLINGKEILITGGTGSLGKTLLKILCTEYAPKGIRIFSRDELKQWELQNEVAKYNKGIQDLPNIPIAFLIGDVRDRERIMRACHGVDIVINCAAMKQVPACEYNPFEAIETNITGIKNIINACIDNGVDKCIHISTDKAVYPVNLYGKTKAVAESLMILSSVYGGKKGTKFNCCRYGNVLGSRGSIIPLFRKQALQGELTITDKRMTRFWITLDRVARFILDRLNENKSGKIFIPKMNSMKVTDLAEALAPACPIRYTGIRKGEKLHECLISEEETAYTKDQGYYFELNPLESFDGKEVIISKGYYTNTNDNWLSVEDLRRLIDENHL